jgi:hypothetical protein
VAPDTPEKQDTAPKNNGKNQADAKKGCEGEIRKRLARQREGLAAPLL